ncbi:ABC transporter substrate-binding protein [Paenibacillus sp. 32O-W]|uniref:aliphatic sulfonate ABC transporter substrate-binding protein n=1 Tax=Paenibacillus sp. 32O-W TaxID=1695218 RepID=UPI0006A2C635|nr:aliphatic sulfonate ABC transporter substrate-binding protein [Paenibacillus sp. 32O-W]AKU19375.1 hypothetical protein [Paenibacillus sp. 32O-W]ALS28663.1 ABC transporter substrate-binding protein [Paenibacillus sp. 32O-W]
MTIGNAKQDNFKRNRLTGICLLILLAVIVSLLGGCASQSGNTPAAGEQATDNGTFRVGYQKGGETLLLKKKKLLETKLGEMGYKVEWAEFNTGSSILEALSTGNIDFANSGDAPSVFALSKGHDFVYVAGTPSAEKSEGILVKDDSGINSVADLKGKKIAFNKASISQYLLTLALQKEGLTIDDVEPVYLNPPEASVAFAQGQVDAWVVWDPYFTVAADTEGNRILTDATGIVPYRSFYESTRQFAEKHPDVIEETVKLLQGVAEEIDKDPSEAAALLQEATNIPVATWEKILKNRPSEISFMDEEAAGDLQKMADDFVEIGFIDQPLKINDAVWKPQ